MVNLYKSNGIRSMRIYDPDIATLQALQNSGINLILGVPNELLQSLASNPSAAMEWVQTNVVPFASSIRYIAVGNEVPLSDPAAPSIAPAMQNVLNALSSVSLGSQVKVSTSISMGLLQNSPPPSNGEFSDTSYITPIINFLKSNGSPLLANVYPYFTYIQNKDDIDIEFALFGSSATPFHDQGNGLEYQNLFDILVDTVYTALGKVGAPDMKVVVSETGWPSDGGDSATVDNARTYYNNVMNHVNSKQGTPLKPGQGIETYLFAMFDENGKKGDPTENHFGIFSPNQQSKYQLTFN